MYSMLSDLEGSSQQHMEALLEGLKSCGKGTTLYKVPSLVYPDNSKAGLKEIESAVNTFEERSSKMDATDLETIYITL
jgi:hypothetical protein